MAPSCEARIDLIGGDIQLRQSGVPAGPSASHGPRHNGPVPPISGVSHSGTAASAWFFRLSTLRMKLALVVLAGSVLAGSAVWAMNVLFAIKPGKCTAIGLTLRTDRHVASLIRNLDPYVPSPNRDRGKDTYSISLFLVPLDGSGTRLIPLRSGLSPGAFGLARILGSDGRTLRFDVAGIGGLDLDTHGLRPQLEVSRVDPRTLPRPWGSSPIAPKPEHFLAAGLMTSPNAWLGLHSAAEAERSFRPQQWIRPVVHAEGGKQMRRFHVGQLQLDGVTGLQRIVGMRVVDDTAAPIRMDKPAGALMLYTSAPGLNQTAVVSRVDAGGQVQWRTDIGIDRFALKQILPGQDTTVFVGTRPPVPGKVSEPLLVVVDHHSGRQVTHSLWQ